MSCDRVFLLLTIKHEKVQRKESVFSLSFFFCDTAGYTYSDAFFDCSFQFVGMVWLDVRMNTCDESMNMRFALPMLVRLSFSC